MTSQERVTKIKRWFERLSQELFMPNFNTKTVPKDDVLSG